MFGLACASQHAAMMQCVQLCCRLHVLLASHCNQKQAYAYGTRSHLLLFVCSKTTTCCRCIFLLLQAAGPLLSSYTNLTLGVRLGLLSPDSQHILLLHARHSSSGSNATRVRQPVYAGGGLGCVRSFVAAAPVTACRAQEWWCVLLFAANHAWCKWI